MARPGRRGRITSSKTLSKIAEILAGERCDNCDEAGPTTKRGARYVCKRCVLALEDA